MVGTIPARTAIQPSGATEALGAIFGIVTVPGGDVSAPTASHGGPVARIIHWAAISAATPTPRGPPRIFVITTIGAPVSIDRVDIQLGRAEIGARIEGALGHGVATVVGPTTLTVVDATVVGDELAHELREALLTIADGMVSGPDTTGLVNKEEIGEGNVVKGLGLKVPASALQGTDQGGVAAPIGPIVSGPGVLIVVTVGDRQGPAAATKIVIAVDLVGVVDGPAVGVDPADATGNLVFLKQGLTIESWPVLIAAVEDPELAIVAAVSATVAGFDAFINMPVATGRGLAVSKATVRLDLVAVIAAFNAFVVMPIATGGQGTIIEAGIGLGPVTIITGLHVDLNDAITTLGEATIVEAGISRLLVAVITSLLTQVEKSVAATGGDAVVETSISLEPIAVVTGLIPLHHPIAAAW